MRTNRSMQKSSILILVWILSGFFAQSNAQQKENALPSVAEKFIGEWRGVGTTADGETFHSDLIFTWTLNRHFLKVENVIQSGGKPQLFATTYYGWQPVLKQIQFWSFDRDGTINEGAAKFDGKTLSHEWRSFSPNGEITDWRSSLELQSKQQLVFTLSDGNRLDGNTVVYKRKK